MRSHVLNVWVCYGCQAWLVRCLLESEQTSDIDVIDAKTNILAMSLCESLSRPWLIEPLTNHASQCLEASVNVHRLRCFRDPMPTALQEKGPVCRPASRQHSGRL
jgi:hypothetical protein